MRRYRTTALTVFVATPLLLVACGTGPLRFEKPGMTTAQLQLDQKECGLASADDTDHGQFPSPFYRVDRDEYAKCMASRGYTVMRGSKVAAR
jgi:hypothetical protein